MQLLAYLRAGGVPAITALLFAGCSGAPGPLPAATVTVTPRPAVSPTASSKQDITVSESDDGRTLHVSVGQRVVLLLHSTYWMIDGSSDPAAIQPDGDATASPAPGCVPGAGCGTVSEVFVAVRPGVATLRASRTSCGEALACTDGQGSFAVSLTVTG